MTDTVLILKVVRNDLTSYNRFKWPESGPVKPERWDPTERCGDGLHGWLNGEGRYRHEFMTGKWIVFRAPLSGVVKLDGGDKCKASEGEVVYCGDQAGAVALLIAEGALTRESSPGWCALSKDQMREVAYRAANRAIKVHAPKALRARGREADALKLEGCATITSYETARAAQQVARGIDADAAAYAAYAADAADYAAYAADAAAYAADAAAAAADAAAAWWVAHDKARADECEMVRLDMLDVLGLK